MINDHIHFGGGGDAVFGLERRAYERAGYEVFTFSQSAKNEITQSSSDFVYREEEGKIAQKFGKFISERNISRTLSNIIEKVRPNLIRVHLISKYPASIYPVLEGQNVIQTLHGPNLFCASSWGVRKNGCACELGIGAKCFTRGCMSLTGSLLYSYLDSRVQPWVKKVVRLFHCPSKQIEEKANALGYGPTVHIPLGIDHNFMHARRASHEGPPTILYIGALVEEKGLLLLPEALEIVRKSVTNVKLALCGVGPLERRLRAEFLNRGLGENVEFRGFIEHQKVEFQYCNASVLVLPSIWAEQFGLVGPEALACGIPCVGSNIGGIPEWLKDGGWGFLVPPRDPGTLANRLSRLLLDKGLRLKFGAAGREYARTIHDPLIYEKRLMDMTKMLV
jgi:glycosyltransferase involved in cell wall biosynthesis